MFREATTWILAAMDLGEPRVVGPYTLFPVRPNMLSGERMVTVGEAITSLIVKVEELPDGPSVGALQVVNDGDLPVLVKDGELFVAGMQDRVAARVALVSARTKATLPVNCVERGRWNGGGRQHFDAATLSAELGLRHANMAGAARRPSQAKTWESVAGRRQARGHGDESGSLVDSQLRDLDAVNAMVTATPPVPVATGMVLCRTTAKGPRVALVEWCADPEAFAVAWPSILRGALVSQGSTGPAPHISRSEVRKFLSMLLGSLQWVEDDPVLGCLGGFSWNGAEARMLVQGEGPIYLAALGS